MAKRSKTTKTKKAGAAKAAPAPVKAAKMLPPRAGVSETRTPAKGPQPPLKNGSPDLSQATHVTKMPGSGKLIYHFQNGAKAEA